MGRLVILLPSHFLDFLRILMMMCGGRVFFFFQAEDGIRDWSVTGVQTCALPIWPGIGCPSKLLRTEQLEIPNISAAPKSTTNTFTTVTLFLKRRFPPCQKSL